MDELFGEWLKNYEGMLPKEVEEDVVLMRILKDAFVCGFFLSQNQKLLRHHQYEHYSNECQENPENIIPFRHRSDHPSRER